MIGTRVLKAHREAAKSALLDMGAINIDLEVAAAILAEAVLTAEDGDKTRYVVGERTPQGRAVVYGPYATFNAAQTAITTGAVGTSEGSTAGVWPLVPAPKKKKKGTTA